MTPDPSPPADVLAQLERLQDATASMKAIDEDLRLLEQRVVNGDMKAAHLALRTIAEAMLRHAARVEKAENTGRGELAQLVPAVRASGKLHKTFWTHVDSVQDFGNLHAHHQADDIYQASTLRPAHDPWHDLGLCLGHLASMAREFVVIWPPPAGVTVVAPPEPTQKVGNDDTVATGKEKTLDVTGEQVLAFLAEMTAKEVLEDDEARVTLELVTGLQRRAVSRRLNAAHGRTKIRNLFPERFGGQPRGAERVDTSGSEQDESFLDYEAIGNLTISQARDLDMAESIARLTNGTELGVKRALAKLNGNGVVRRQFSWYEAATIGELTVRTALDYRMAPLLARHLRKRAATVVEALGSAPGQTKLRTLFPSLDD